MKKTLGATVLLAIAMAVPMQAAIVRGTVIDDVTKQPLSGVIVSTAGGSVTTTTAADGTYVLQEVEPGNRAIAFSCENYAMQSVDVTVMQEPSSLNVELTPVNSERKDAELELQASREENTLLFDESMLEDEGATSSQSVAYLAGSSDDPFLSASSYVYSPMRFSIRGSSFCYVAES